MTIEDDVNKVPRNTWTLLQVYLLEVSPGLRYTELRVQVFCCWRPSPSQRAHKLHKAALWLLPFSLSWLCLPLLATPGRGSGRRSACTEEHTGRVNTAPIARWGPGCPAVAPLWLTSESELLLVSDSLTREDLTSSRSRSADTLRFSSCSPSSLKAMSSSLAPRSSPSSRLSCGMAGR